MMSKSYSSLRRGIALTIVGIAAVAALSTASLAQSSTPLRIIVGFSPGGGVDIVARLIGKELGEEFNRPVVIDNRPGAAGQIGAQQAARAEPNGDTLVVGSPGAFTVAPSLYPSLPYNPAQDFAPITNLVRIPSIFVASLKFPAKNMRELLDLAAKKPGSVTFGSGGVGSALHLAGELVNYMGKVQMLHVPYKGTAPGLNDVVGGHVDVFMSDVSGLPLVRAGNVRILGITAAKPVEGMEDLPLIGETIPGYEADNWYGLLAPANTPPNVIAAYNKAAVKALANPAIREKLLALGMQPSPTTPEEFTAFLRKDAEKWRTVIKAANIKPE